MGEDEKQKEKVDAKNHLESYCFNIKSSLEDNASKGKISDDEKSTIFEKCNETIAWLDKNQSAEVEEFKEKQTHLEKKFTQTDKMVKVTQLLEAVALKVDKDSVGTIME